jgi:hypothetical protein
MKACTRHCFLARRCGIPASKGFASGVEVWITCPMKELRGSCNLAHSKGQGDLQTKALEKWMLPGNDYS